MARKSRNNNNAKFLHVMVQGLNKENIFYERVNKQKYLKLIKIVKKEFNINIIAYCIMDNHVHMLVKIDEISILSQFMHKLNTLYALYYNKKYTRVGYVFRNRYKSQIIYSEKQLYTCINYIHNNPVKANVCRFPSEYIYSSYDEYTKNIKLPDIYFKDMIDKGELVTEKELMFLEEENEEEIKEFIEKYLISHKLNLDKLKESEENLKELINLLRSNYNLSLRKISVYVHVCRETVRKIAKEI